MELWIRSTARTNLLKPRFLTVMQGKKFYNPAEWEYKGYTICNCNDNGCYELLGTYKTKERALEVLDEIQKLLQPQTIINYENKLEFHPEYTVQNIVKTIPKTEIKELSTCVYEMPEE